MDHSERQRKKEARAPRVLSKKAQERAKIFDSLKLEEKEKSVYERICRL